MAKINLSQGIDSLTSFKRNTGKFLKRLRSSGTPVVLTINGKAEVVVQDADAYQRLLDLAEQTETIQAVEKSLKQYGQGRGKSAAAALKKLRRRINVDRAE
jgi:prevent-host-death family protein